MNTDLSVARWRKSSRSDEHGGSCVQVAGVDPMDAQWRKSSRSGGQGGECVEIANLAFVIAVRDSKDPECPKLILDAADWRALARRIKACEHDLA
ncbi:DUF397 domain-containing protein [Actinomadura rugatobispora]|uniref:DUF397 domain-containing protein n=1 Tax=Actinomadura rugatobispora TaxID=1994 RepID=A0ABW0ZTK4_9ACTN|nr:DUF397 domain-containing protein [Actinomadura rugatobispora]